MGAKAARRGRQRNAASRLPVFGGAQRQVGVSAAYATGQISRAPAIRASRDSCNIVHRELVYTVVDSSDPFAVLKTIAINPGVRASFPWLATQAVGWQYYRFNSLRFCYYTRSATSQVGSLMLIPDYDAADAAPGSEQIASSYEDVAEDVPWKDITCSLRPSAMDGVALRHFVRTGAVPSGQDVKLFDVGNLHVASCAGGGGVAIGKLWAEYDVTFSTPQLPPEGVLNVMTELESGGATIAAATPWGTIPVQVSDGLSVFADTTTNTLNFNAFGASGAHDGQDYLLVVTGTGTVITAATLTSASAAAVVKTTLFQGFPTAALTFAIVKSFTFVNADAVQLVLGLTATTITDVKVNILPLNATSMW